MKPGAPLTRPGHGLRREEPAMLAGVSVDYVIRLEQGRATRSSGQVIEALARALRLNPDERAHLAPPGRTRPARPGHGARPPHTERAAAAGPPRRHPGRRPGRGDDLARRELRVRGSDGDPSMLLGLSRNRLRHHFLGPPGRVRRTQEELRDFGTRVVTELRSVAGHHPADPRLRELIDELGIGRVTSPVGVSDHPGHAFPRRPGSFLVRESARRCNGCG
ncbi:helix-turn-helix domain-containing protein [Streptomyces pseudogriseolus]|uniref:helix-turn-helix domain-containing protein n=1 Tax=Streptomyces pseudogriseolus TaxID=36817 RepID=UPI003FA28BC0